MDHCYTHWTALETLTTVRNGALLGATVEDSLSAMEYATLKPVTSCWILLGKQPLRSRLGNEKIGSLEIEKKKPGPPPLFVNKINYITMELSRL